MSDSFKEILDRVWKETDLKNQTELAEMLGIRSASISDAKTRGKFPSDWVVKINLKYGINPAWLLTGEGPIISNSPPTTEEKNRIWGETRKEELRKRPRPTQEERHLRHIVEWMDDEFTKYPDNGLSFYLYLRDNYDSFRLFIEKK